MKKKIYWLLQSNQFNPCIISFLDTIRLRVKEQLDLIFIIPETSSDIMEKISILNPKVFKVKSQTAVGSLQVYLAKKKGLSGAAFTDGLLIEDTLLHDDLGGGTTRRTIVEIPVSKELGGLILQIPTPLGSSESEEMVFQSAIAWANHNRIPAIGYEMLPLDTKWTLAASLPGGIITRDWGSHIHLKSQISNKNIWLLPNFEATVFSPVSTNFHLNGAKAAYHFKNEYQISSDKIIYFLPHNVAMIYEYHQLLKEMISYAGQIHLMFAVGKDQIRGAHSQREMVELIYKKELEKFQSYSFHEMGNPWEMMLADAVIACAECFNTMVAQKEMPCIVYDPSSIAVSTGHKKRINSSAELKKLIENDICRHGRQNELSDILMALCSLGRNDD